jgi:hypothetical protein
MARPIHHGFIRKLGLLPFERETPGPGFIVAVHEDGQIPETTGGLRSLCKEGQTGLALEKQPASGSDKRRKSRHPLEGLGTLPLLAGPMRGDHLLDRWHADRIEVEHFDIIAMTLREPPGDRRLS